MCLESFKAFTLLLLVNDVDWSSYQALHGCNFAGPQDKGPDRHWNRPQLKLLRNEELDLFQVAHKLQQTGGDRPLLLFVVGQKCVIGMKDESKNPSIVLGDLSK